MQKQKQIKYYDSKQHKTTSRKTKKIKEQLETKKPNKTKRKSKNQIQKWETERKEETKEQERERERETKKEKVKKEEAQKRLKRNKGRHSKRNQKGPFLGGKTGFFLLKETKKARQGKKQKQKKYGGFRAKWGGPLGHLTWPLNPPKKTKTKKQK